MRQINVKYAGNCRKCGAPLSEGSQAMYEKHIGIFCTSCGPTDSEEIRAYRQEAGDRRAARYEGWAEKRIEKAGRIFEHDRHYTDDIAFNTQPGHIPFRARMNTRHEREFESLQKAKHMKEKAAKLRCPRVAGDKERERQEKRDKIRQILKIGQKVVTGLYGDGIVKRINKKTATIEQCGISKAYTTNIDLSWLKLLED